MVHFSEISIVPIFYLANPLKLGTSNALQVSQTNHLMNIRSFVGVSSAVLLAWLGATYFHKIPSERYPRQGRPSASSEKTPAGERIADLGSTQR